MNTDEAEEVTFDKLEPRYRAEAIRQYKAFLKFSKAMKKDPLHKKITETAKRIRDEHRSRLANFICVKMKLFSYPLI